ncbi:MAG: hypothetical protein ACR2RF_09730 [Geminicoccaceae bacterium]
MTTEDSTDNANDDNLTRIKGIGQARQAWFAKVFDINSFSGLAALSVDQIEAALKAEKRSMITRSDIQDWLVQARELAAAKEAAAPVAAEIQKAGGAAMSDWAPFASFVVEYRRREADDAAGDHQTHVHHVEGDENGTWPGLEAEAVGPWMLERAESATMPEPDADDQEQTPAPLPSVTALPPDAEIAIRLTQVQIRQPATAEPASLGGAAEASSGFIKSAEPFALDAAFELIGQDAADLTRRAIPYICQFYVRDLATGASIHLGDTIPGSLNKDQLTYETTLFFTTLPEGAYRMHVLALLQSSPPVPGHLEVPILQAL